MDKVCRYFLDVCRVYRTPFVFAGQAEQVRLLVPRDRRHRCGEHQYALMKLAWSSSSLRWDALAETHTKPLGRSDHAKRVRAGCIVLDRLDISLVFAGNTPDCRQGPMAVLDI